MKSFFLLIVIFFIGGTFKGSAQQLMTSQFFEYIDTQDMGNIKEELELFRFAVLGSREKEGKHSTAFQKKSSLGEEYITIVVDSVYFKIFYKTTFSPTYDHYKQQLLIGSKNYLKTLNNTKYYGLYDIIVGFNDETKVISFIKEVK
ncbi:hypothetical protein [Myroides pelagicus]|uniref:Uncharacterized protein n=1 Tax=Myroides pelagicus TaxID=270914 RepID=A0A7K1GI15_9FLAO|nr:hypothetical protein [Myroides pelagicus]MEC4112503.1 hypothetical protein [Myroides pelagicus]MTH28577.1 hypothetical protein [Myroides pelagicus]